MTTVYVVTFYDETELTTIVCGVYRTRESADKSIDNPEDFGDLYEILEMPLED